MELESLLLHSQVPATCPYPDPTRSSPHPFIPLPEDPLNIIFPSTPRYPQWLLSHRFPLQTLCTPLLSPIRATCPAHLIILDFITGTILAEKYRSLSCSLCSFLHSAVTSPLLGPNILLSTLFSDTNCRLTCQK